MRKWLTQKALSPIFHVKIELKTRKLGKNGFEVSAIGLGCMEMSYAYGPASEKKEMIKAVAADKNATPTQITLAWLLAQKPWIVPIPGTRKLVRLYEHIGAADIELNPEELCYINSALLKIPILKDRSPKELKMRSGR